MYTAEITRAHPGCFIFLLDQSGSMADRIGGGDGALRKCDVVSDAINRLLQEIAVRCAKEEGIRDYFQISVLGYGARVGPALTGALAGYDVATISQVATQPSRIERRPRKVSDGAGGLVEVETKFPVWVDATADGPTPMCQALERARAIVERWFQQLPASFPPVVLNLTDGESTDGSPENVAGRLRALAGLDGPALLFNLHVSSDQSLPLRFPDSEVGLPNDYARQLFRMSSPLPTGMRHYALAEGFSVTSGSRGFAFNANPTLIVQFLDIGTRATSSGRFLGERAHRDVLGPEARRPRRSVRGRLLPRGRRAAARRLAARPGRRGHREFPVQALGPAPGLRLR